MSDSEFRDPDILRPFQHAPAKEHLFASDGIHFPVIAVCSGMAATYVVEGQGRQLVSIQIPGDVIALSGLVNSPRRRYAAALSRVRYRVFGLSALVVSLQSDLNLLSLFLKNVALYRDQADELALDLGTATAQERIGRFILRTYLRLQSIGLAEDGMMEFPLSISQIGEATGLTRVHTCRVLGRLEKLELIRRNGRMMSIIQLTELIQESNYMLPTPTSSTPH